MHGFVAMKCIHNDILILILTPFLRSNEVGVFANLTNAYCLVAQGAAENFFRYGIMYKKCRFDRNSIKGTMYAAFLRLSCQNTSLWCNAPLLGLVWLGV